MTITELETGAARRQRARKPPPRVPEEVIIQLHNYYPGEDRLENIGRFVRLCIEDNLFHAEFAEYWARLNYSRLTSTRTALTLSERQDAARAQKEAVGQAVRIAKRAFFIITLRTTMPDGRALREWTCADCSALGGQIGLIAKAGKPKQKVGDIFKTDADLCKALKGATK